MATDVNTLSGTLQRFRQNGWDRPAGGGVSEAIRQGEILALEIWNDGGMLTSPGAAKILGVTPRTINRMHKDGRLVGLSIKSSRSYHYPSWQFDEKLMASIQHISKLLNNYDDWMKYLFFVQREPLLGGKYPLEVLHRGLAEQVIRVAKLLNADAG